MSNREVLKKMVRRFGAMRIGVLGFLVAETYLTGTTERVIRESPVLIVRANSEELVPGGAANVACNLASLGAKVSLFGVVGQDAAAGELKKNLSGRGIDIKGVVCDRSYGTVKKTRILAGAKHTLAQQVLRIDQEPEVSPSKRTLSQIQEAVIKVDRKIDGWIISDYGYHLFGDEMIAQMRSIAAKKPGLADSRFQITRFAGLTAIKPNEQEALEAAEVKNNGRAGVLSAAEKLKQQVGSKVVIITLGNQGILVYQSRDEYRFVPAVGTDKILDLTGAGDTAGAALILAMAAGADFYQAAMIANCAGSIVVMKYGCACCYPAELLKVIHEQIKQ